jgi:hypothetical protein
MHKKHMAFSLVLRDFGVRPGNSRTSSYSTACALYFKLRSVAFRVPPNHEPGTSISTHRSTCSGPGYCLTISTNLAIAYRPPSIASRPPPPAIAKTCALQVHARQVMMMMMMSFICSFRNKNEPTAILSKTCALSAECLAKLVH